MVRNFKGEVKISDVKAEFDNLVDRINNMVDSYNISGKVEDIDYTVGGVNLSPAGYTLSVGGLKKGLESVARNVIGGKCFKISDDKFKITDGLILTKKGAIRLPDAVIDKYPNYHTLYYNSITNQYQWVAGAAYREEVRVKEFNSCNVFDEETGLYKLLNAEGQQLYGIPFKYWANAYSSYQLSNLDRFTAIDQITYDSPRVFSDPESLVQKVKLDITKQQWIPLNSNETELKDIVFDMDIGDYGHYSPQHAHCSGILLGKYEYNDNFSGFNTFDPRIGIEFNMSWGSFGSDTQNGFGIHDYTINNSDRFYVQDVQYGKDALLLRSTVINKWLSDNQLPEIYPDISHIRITFEEHNNKFMIVARWTLKTIRFDHYVGDLYNSEGIKRDYDNLYSIIFLDNKYKDIKVGNVALLSEGYNNDSQHYNMYSMFNPDLYKVNGVSPVTDKANVYYTVLIPTEDSEDVFRICDINMNRDSKFITDFNTIQTENFNGYYKITSESKTFGSGGTLRYSNVSLDSNKPNFISGIDAERFEREGTSYVHLFGDPVAWNSQPGHRNLNYWTPANILFLPKGISNPFNVSNGDASKSFKVIIDKKVE